MNLDERIRMAILQGMSLRKAKPTETTADAPRPLMWLKTKSDGELWFIDVDSKSIKQLLRDVIEYVKPEKIVTDGADSFIRGYNEAVDDVKANAKELGL